MEQRKPGEVCGWCSSKAASFCRVYLNLLRVSDVSYPRLTQFRPVTRDKWIKILTRKCNAGSRQKFHG